MKFRTFHLVAALALAASTAFAQSNPPSGQPTPPDGSTLSNANIPTTTPDDGAVAARIAGRIEHEVPQMTFVDEPTASVSKPDDTANAIAQAINGDASLKGCKITVQQDADQVLLTGSAFTKAQVKRAGEIAASQAGEGKVVNTILAAEA